MKVQLNGRRVESLQHLVMVIHLKIMRKIPWLRERASVMFKLYAFLLPKDLKLFVN